MNEIKSYRLGEYRITEYDNVLYSWKRHAALAEQYGGKCFIQGNVLIIGDCSHQETGYLIGEFLDQLQKWPEWNKTRYYCLASSLLDVNTNHSLTDDFLAKRLSSVDSADLKSDINLRPGTFRLGQYQITVTDNHEVCWQTYEGLSKISGGRCIIDSALLFIGSKEYDKEGHSERDFLDTLTQLPKWDKTMAWSHSEVLLPCWQEQERDKPRFAVTSERKSKEYSFDISTATLNRYQYKETAAKILSQCVKWITALWKRAHVKRVLKKYLILLLSCLVFAVAIFLFAQDKVLQHWKKEHHHKHHD
jgi:hypothetical protein